MHHFLANKLAGVDLSGGRGGDISTFLKARLALTVRFVNERVKGLRCPIIGVVNSASAWTIEKDVGTNKLSVRLEPIMLKKSENLGVTKFRVSR